jgi:hypothetical protein
MPIPEKSEHKKSVQTLQRALQALRDAEAKVKAAAPTPDTTWQGSSIALGIPAIVIGAGLAILALHFLLGIIIGCAGSVLLLLASLYLSRKQSASRRIVVSLGSFALCLGLFAWLWFRPDSIEVTALPMSGGYKSGTVIAGIKWDENYSEARIIIQNNSSTAYTDINALVRTDLFITKIGSMNPNSHCQSRPFTPFQITGAALNILGKDKTPQRAIPLFTPEREGAYGSQFKLYCDKLLAGEMIEAVVALVSPLERIPPQWISAEVEFDAFGRTRSARPLRQCLVDKCGQIPVIEK